LYFSPNVLGCVGHLACTGNDKSIHGVSGCPAGKELLGRLGTDGDNANMYQRTMTGRMWTGFIWVRIGVAVLNGAIPLCCGAMWCGRLIQTF
jgi:hypothetical protein